jgi:hypothetical protein
MSSCASLVALVVISGGVTSECSQGKSSLATR